MSENPFSPTSENHVSLEKEAALSKPNPSLEYCGCTVEETLAAFQTDTNKGLPSLHIVNERRAKYGSNNCAQDEDSESLIWQFITTFTQDPLILLLIGSALISFIMGNIDDAISITLAIVIVVTVGFVQEYRSEKSLEALNHLVPAECHLIRCGIESNGILASTLVPGDLVRFKVGDRIPADLRIVEAVGLTIDESNLTGENEPVSKNVDPVILPDNGAPNVSQRSCIAYMGTLVREGHGKGIVVGTGKDTAFGAVFDMMSSIEKPKTPLQQAMDKLGKDLSLISFVLIGLICLLGIFQGRSWLDMFQISVSLAVAAIPEGLPIIVTVTLALGVLRMANRKAIVRRLPSVETLGSVNVICSDKTGTLTQNHMTVSKIWSLGSMQNKQNILNIETCNKKTLKNYLNDDTRELLTTGNICNNAIFSQEQFKFLGNPTDVALLEVLGEFDLVDCRTGITRSTELPFTSQRKIMATGITSNNKETFYIKGAYEKILQKATHYLTKEGKTEKLNSSLSKMIEDCAESMAGEGLRVLAFAKMDNTTKKTIIDEKDLGNLVFIGLMGMKDPPRPNVHKAVEKLLEGSVHIIMITGDSPRTAVSIARQIGIPVVNEADSCITGDKLDVMNEDELASVIDHVNIFARATPQHKLNIVRALQKRGDVVAMTGDGVNDAPALKLADIGISMGNLGTDVAKEASDMVLTDDDFSTILTAIEEGKGIFNNIQNFLTFQLSTSVAALSLVALSTALNLPNPLNAMQILWINILMDGPPAQSLGVEPVDHEVMKKPPRRRTDKILTSAVLKRLLTSAIFIICGTVFIFVREIDADGQVTSRDTTMTFTCFVFFDMFNALACRHSTKSIFKIGVFANKMFNFAVGLSILGQLCAIYVPFFQSIFKTESLSLYDLLFLLCISSTVFIADELRKYIFRSRNPTDIPFVYSQV
ncbi:probable Calcium-transporting ATPase 1 [Saccharomycodes ludwigii]|uniref:Calcium-transporting ATPase n=1 Tax=Saccharomycodes ludwigii TaxID=36035 RepID=A0A376B328_9ASCO|nr:probable Calcium-transporting ATPase 1 [Saccharomycodes ludwigii]